tara:strand:+ start:2565 stop:2858 length:294 start_codon:yes stop_codon:yes gene_type:complete
MNTEKLTTENSNLPIYGVMHREYQEKIFNAIKNMKHRMQGLAGYVQNDFERMLEDGTTTKETINAEIIEMDKQYDEVIAELNELREQARDIMKYHGA